MRLKVMLKRNINQYNDGVLKFGKYSEKYNQDGKLLNEKEFIQEGKLFFHIKPLESRIG